MTGGVRCAQSSHRASTASDRRRGARCSTSSRHRCVAAKALGVAKVVAVPLLSKPLRAQGMRGCRMVPGSSLAVARTCCHSLAFSVEG